MGCSSNDVHEFRVSLVSTGYVGGFVKGRIG